jgi:phospholipid/cholesterol/gamma-HCH transport system ATP-binding protein
MEGSAEPAGAVDAESAENAGRGRSEAASPSAPCIRLRGVRKAFGPLTVFDGLDLEIPRGRTTVILGPSGVGKSVLLKHIVGLMPPDAGEVWFEGQRVDELDRKGLVALRRRFGFLFQMGALFDSMTAGANVGFPLREHTSMSRRDREERVRRLLRMVAMEEAYDKMPASLSGGQRKRVALARAIALKPDVVLYDEPSTGLDPIRAALIDELISVLREQLRVTGVVVTHDVSSALRIADRIVMLYGGRIVAEGTPQQLREADVKWVRDFLDGNADPDELERIRSGFERTELESLSDAEADGGRRRIGKARR